MLRRFPLALTLVALLLLARPTQAGTITVAYTDPVTGWEWAQVVDTVGFSWYQVATVCATDGATACTGSLGPVDDVTDFTGWTWATQDQVRDLLVNVTGLPQGELSDYYHAEANSTWAPQFLELFAASYTDPSVRGVLGVTATTRPTNSLQAFVVEIGDRENSSDPDSIERTGYSKGSQLSSRGFWLHREAPQSVPDRASTLVLLTLGLASLIAARSRSRLRRSH